jgi:predicted transcriptional regulator YdeE
MKYSFEHKNEMYFVGLSQRLKTTKKDFDSGAQTLWTQFINGNILEEVKKYMICDRVVGVTYDMDPISEEVSYLVGIEVSSIDIDINIDLCKIYIPESNYAIFQRIGPMSKAMTFKDQLFSEVFLNKAVELTPIAEIEFYYKGDSKSSSFKFEYWVSIR